MRDRWEGGPPRPTSPPGKKGRANREIRGVWVGGGEKRACVPPCARKFCIIVEKVLNRVSKTTTTSYSVLLIVGTIVYSTTFSDIARMPHPASS